MATFGFFGGADLFRELRWLQSEMDRVMGAFVWAWPVSGCRCFPGR